MPLLSTVRPHPASSPHDAGQRRRGRRLVAGVLAAGIAVSAAVAWHEAHVPGSWSSQVSVLFLAPHSATNPNALAVSSDSIVTTAGVVGRMVDRAVEPLASTTVTITGRGVRDGFSVELPNSGGQNATNFVTPELDVQAVTPSAAATITLLRRVIGRIRSTLARLQADAGVAARNAITTSLSPPTTPLFYERGSRSRAFAATLLLGLGLSFAAAGGVRGFLRRRTRAVPDTGVPDTSTDPRET